MVTLNELLAPFLQEIPNLKATLSPGKQKKIDKFLDLLITNDGPEIIAKELPKIFDPQDVVQNSSVSRLWEIIGMSLLNLGRSHEALSIFMPWYDHVLAAQVKDKKLYHKGPSLVWISECLARIQFPAISHRYLMLTLICDAIGNKGKIDPNAGVYYRMVWKGGLSPSQVKDYTTKAYNLYKRNPKAGRYPEWILQRLDKGWMTRPPSPMELGVYIINPRYIKWLLTQPKKEMPKSLEWAAEYLLSCMPGCRTKLRVKTHSSDLDVLCSMEGAEIDFRSELGRYFICECKYWNKAADFTTMAKFCRLLDSVKSKFGIIFSKKGISGAGIAKHAEREQIKVFQDRGIVIIVFDWDDLQRVCEGVNFISLLRSKYEKVRLDLSGKALA